MARGTLLAALCLLSASLPCAGHAGVANILPLKRLPWEGGAAKSLPGCPWIVEFFHPECGGCRALAGPFHALAKRMVAEGLPCAVASIDCDENQAYCVEQGALEYPLLRAWSGDASRHAEAALQIPYYDHAGANEAQMLEEALWLEVQEVCVVADAGVRRRCAEQAKEMYDAAAASNDVSSSSVDGDVGGDGGGMGSLLQLRPEVKRLQEKTAPPLPRAAFSPDVVWTSDLRHALHFVLSSERVGDGEEGQEAVLPVRQDEGGWVGVKADVRLLLSRTFPSRAVREILLSSAWSRDKVVKYLKPPQRARGGVRWRGCAGSEEHYRGLPCGLWQLFHTVLTACVELRCKEAMGMDPLDVIRRWVVNYFNCATCRRHFEEGSKGWATAPMSEEQQVLTLWRFHNVVNERLAGDATDDPRHRKGVFPSKTQCPHCYIEKDGVPQAALSDERVFDFLMEFFPKVGVTATSGDLTELAREERTLQKGADGLSAMLSSYATYGLFLVAFAGACSYLSKRYRFWFIKTLTYKRSMSGIVLPQKDSFFDDIV